jgi:hypothetical protein
METEEDKLHLRRNFPTMNARLVGAATLTFVAASLLIIEILSWPQSARFNPGVDPSSRCSLRVVSVGMADKRAGLSVGDNLVLDKMDLASRVAVFFRYLPNQLGRANETIQLVIERGDRQFTLPYLLTHTDALTTFLGQLGFKIFILIVGVFVL